MWLCRLVWLFSWLGLVSGVGQLESFLFPSAADPQKFLAVKAGRSIALPLHNSGGDSMLGEVRFSSSLELQAPEATRAWVPSGATEITSPAEHATHARHQSSLRQRPLMAVILKDGGYHHRSVRLFDFMRYTSMTSLSGWLNCQIRNIYGILFRVRSLGEPRFLKFLLSACQLRLAQENREISFPTFYPDITLFRGILPFFPGNTVGNSWTISIDSLEG